MSKSRGNVTRLLGAKNPELVAIAEKMRKIKTSSEAWPMIVFEEILATSDRWDAVGVGHDSGYKSINDWIKDCFGNGWNLAKFKLVQSVVGRLGEHVKRTWAWPAAQWAYNNLSEAELREAISQYKEWTCFNREHPLSLSMLKRRIGKARAESVESAAE